MKIIHNILLAGALLSCSGTAFAAEETSYTKPTGTYVGTYRFVMNTADTQSTMITNLPTKISTKGVEYKTLGYSATPGLWKWDFDNMKVTWGGSQLFALEAIRIKYQIYNQNMEEEKAGFNMESFTPAKETYPHISSEDEITMDIIDNNDGTYLVNFGKKIHLSLQGYPFGKTTGKFKVSFQNEKLKIESLDYETDGGELDGIPGGRIAEVFPLVAQPSYYSVEMKKDTGEDSNDDGITDIEAEFLGLDKNVLDTDGDGINDIDEMISIYTPEDTDEDGIPNYLEGGDEAQKGYLLGKITSEIGPSFSIENQGEYRLSGQYFIFEHYDSTLRNRASTVIIKAKGDIPPKINENGVEIYYKTLNLNFHDDIVFSVPEKSEKFIMTFENKIPENFEVYLGVLNLTPTGDIDLETGLEVANYTYSKIDWKKTSENQITFNSFNEEGIPGKIIFAMGEKRKVYFIDSAVEGIKYLNTDLFTPNLKFTNPGYEGETGEDGSFYYGSGEVKFSVGNVKIGTISKVNEDGKIFIQDIVGVQRDNIENETVLKIAQFLQSLDSDTTTENIEIDDISVAALEAEGVRDIQSSDFNVEEVLTAANIEIKPMEEVKEHLKNSLIANGIIEDETNSGNDNTDNNGGSGGSGGSFSWLLLSLLALTLFKRKK